MKKQIVIIGAGAYARQVLTIIDECNQENAVYDVLGYIVDEEYGSPGTLVNEKPILGGFEWFEKYHDKVSVVCAVNLPHHRYHLVKRALRAECRFCNIIHPNVHLTRWITFGEGVVIAYSGYLSNHIRIGNQSHINIYSTIAHDSVIDDFVTITAGVHISGNVEIGMGAYVGTGANVIEKIKIGEWSIVGAGSTIIEDVPPNTTVAGNPGRVIKTRESDWFLNKDEF